MGKSHDSKCFDLACHFLADFEDRTDDEHDELAQVIQDAIEDWLSDRGNRASIQNDGWIEWKGGGCPVADGVKFDVKARDGRIWRSQDSALWDHFGEPYDIVAWRLAK